MNLKNLWANAESYLLQVGLKRFGPAALASGVSALVALAAAHQGLLESWGITFGSWPLQWPAGSEPSGQVILIELDTLTKVGLAAIIALAGTVGAAAAHHGSQAIDQLTGAGADKPAK